MVRTDSVKTARLYSNHHTMSVWTVEFVYADKLSMVLIKVLGPANTNSAVIRTGNDKIGYTDLSSSSIDGKDKQEARRIWDFLIAAGWETEKKKISKETVQ